MRAVCRVGHCDHDVVSRVINSDFKTKYTDEPGSLGQIVALVSSMAKATTPHLSEIYEVYLRAAFPEAWEYIQKWPYVHWVAVHRPRVFCGLFQSNPAGSWPHALLSVLVL